MRIDCGRSFALETSYTLAGLYIYTELINLMVNKSIPYFCGFFLAGYNILMISYWQSTQSTKKALVISLSRSILWPSILIAALPVLLGSEIIWLCHSLSEGITALTVVLLLTVNRKQ